ncbi:TetR/AcrR family transcriptional regulator [Pelomonas sp. V22]|uniref:TetR/AcrR family transcriptional regulator n=1 Tax=Pelomonas sp. V22 TaxID=2822139 RepID=UPI0024A7EE0D|nr:TetR/AcrR family transcriptional regulator [Pelomonas sp. V22]MDI4634671.1 TetR/AcrR family transcriptional regulator [Pelomonas sp. V22]
MSTPRNRTSAADVPRDAYHHGALREALIAAAEAVLAERGLEGFSLREVARRSGVSPAAPAHHFGDAEGLLAAVATLAFDGLTAALKAGDERGGSDPVAQLREQGLGYVGFALKHPGRFGLMFRCEGYKSEALAQSGRAAYGVLEAGVRRLCRVLEGAELTPAQQQSLLAIWSVVHGFAHLALAGQFDSLLPARGREAALRGLLAPLLEQQLQALRPVRPLRRRRLGAEK